MNFKFLLFQKMWFRRPMRDLSRGVGKKELGITFGRFGSCQLVTPQLTP